MTFSIASLLALPFLLAAPEDGGASGSAEGSASLRLADGSTGASADGEAEKKERTGAGDRSDQKWIKRWAPERMMGELGIFGGVIFPDKNHELFRPDAALPNQGHQRFRSVAPDIGLRLGFYPLRFFGVEAEAAVMPTQTANDDRATMFGVRGHLVGQLGLWSVTPFVLVGAGALGVGSGGDGVGSDVDSAFHFGGGVKIYLNRYTQIRLDIRDNLSNHCDVCADGTYERSDATYRAHHPEVLLGLALTLGRKKDEKQPPPEAGPSDRDGDGLLDHEDTCPDDPETFNDFQDDDGCPESDRDGDGFWDDPDQDACPDEPGVAPDGCPIRDTDGDGIMDPDDKCVEEPETRNGYEDADGCPDEIPEEVAKFSGVIEGIYFDTDKDTIKKKSIKILDNAVKVLGQFESIRVRITGHTDSRGGRDHNLDLSRRRAAAVRTYLVDHGIDASRIETDGRGPDEPRDSNNTKAGRANNRRIEFEILK